MRSSASVRVPATSANLGPGFDSVGLALRLHDEYRVSLLDEPQVEVLFEAGGDGVPADASNLVVRSLRAGMERFGVPADAGIRLTCRNVIPHGRGLGSSAAAIVGGVSLAAALSGSAQSQDILQLAAELEGHPDNVAACLLGGYVIAWSDGPVFRATRLVINQRLEPVLFIPSQTSPTEEARQALPQQVPLPDAAFNAGRAALLTVALSGAPELLLAATEDRLHQEQRRGVYPQAMALVDELRGRGVPACVSGAGPSVLAFSIDGAELPTVGGSDMLRPGFDDRGATSPS